MSSAANLSNYTKYVSLKEKEVAFFLNSPTLSSSPGKVALQVGLLKTQTLGLIMDVFFFSARR